MYISAMINYCKWFEPRSISSQSYRACDRPGEGSSEKNCGDGRFDDLGGSHHQSQVNSVCQAMMLYVRSVETDFVRKPFALSSK